MFDPNRNSVGLATGELTRCEFFQGPGLAASDRLVSPMIITGGQYPAIVDSSNDGHISPRQHTDGEQISPSLLDKPKCDSRQCTT